MATNLKPITSDGGFVTGGNISAVGNITGGNLSTTGAISANGNITGANLATAGTANIGTLAVTGTSNLGPVGNVTITGGSNGQYLQTNGSGVLSFATISTTSISNGNSNVSIATANGNVTINSAGNITMTVTGTGANIAGTLSVSGNSNVGNIGATGVVATTLGGSLTTNSQPNITSTGTLASLSVSGNSNIGNIGTGVITATGNITGANLITGGNVQTENIVNITANTSIGMGNGSGIVAIYSAGNATQFLPSGAITLGGVSQIKGGTFTGSYITLGTSQTDIAQDRGGNVTVQVGTGGTIANTWTFTNSGNLLAPGAISASGNITGANLSTAGTANIGTLAVTGTSNLGPVGNVTITGGTNGYVLSTNGSGGLSWIAGGSSASISNGTSNVSIATSGGNVTTSVDGNANIIVVTGTGANITGTLSVSGNVRTGSILTINNTANAWANANATQINTASFYSPSPSIGAYTIIGQNHYWDGVGARYIQTGAASQFYLQGDSFTWASAVSGIANAVASLSPKMTLNGSGNLSVTGNIITSGVVTATGNITGGNVITSGSGGNITGANVITANTFSASGNFIGNTNGFTIGYLNVPQVAASNTTLALSDAGKHYYSTLSGSYTLTIPADNTVAFDIGTRISIVVQSSGNILVNAASGVSLYLSGNSTPGNRTVNQYCVGTLLKVAANTWFIDGTNGIV